MRSGRRARGGWRCGCGSRSCSWGPRSSSECGRTPFTVLLASCWAKSALPNGCGNVCWKSEKGPCIGPRPPYGMLHLIPARLSLVLCFNVSALLHPMPWHATPCHAVLCCAALLCAAGWASCSPRAATSSQLSSLRSCQSCRWGPQSRPWGFFCCVLCSCTHPKV